MKVIFWDNTEVPVLNREEGIKKIKEGLKDWMNTSDKIVWHVMYVGPYKSDKLMPPPNMAVVYNSVGELTDAFAVITD